MKRLLGLLFALLASSAFAQQTCYEWRAGSCSTTSQYFENAVDAANWYVAQGCWNTGSASTNGIWDSQVENLRETSNGFPGMQFDHKYKTTASCNISCSVSQSNVTRTLTSRARPGGCPICPAAGQKQSMSGNGGIGSIPSETCKNGCQFKQRGSRVAGRFGSGVQAWVADYESTGVACSATYANSGLTETSAENGECDPSGRICADKGDAKKNCGVYNGNRVCVESVPPGGCVGYADGSAACKGGSGGTVPPATPPAPNNGTPGEAAEPDAQVASSAGSTVNYYSSSTVSGSSAAPTTGDPSSGGVSNPTGTTGDDSDGDGQPDGNGTGEGSGEFPSECVGPNCNAGTPTLEEIGTLTDAFGGFWSDLQEVPIVAAGSGVSAAFGPGSCPEWSESIYVYGEAWEVDFSGMCTTWTGFASVLSLVMLVFWGFIAFRILFSA